VTRRDVRNMRGSRGPALHLSVASCITTAGRGDAPRQGDEQFCGEEGVLIMQHRKVATWL